MLRNNVIASLKKSYHPLTRLGLVLFIVVLGVTACSSQSAKPVASQTAAQYLPASSPTPVATKTAAAQPVASQTPVQNLPVNSPTSTATQTGPQNLPRDSPTPVATQPAATQPVPAAPLCSSPATLTPALTEGPYFKASSPERASLIEAGTPGIQLTLTGYVLTPDCQPVAHALLDFWQADAEGQYDNAGYTLRGHQFTDENGRYQLITVVPGFYPGRTEHIHFKVQAPNGPVLTSQLFFPGVPGNDQDAIYDPALIIQITQDSGSSIQATFNFVVNP
jgi:protocatechuate 3,4-dioxygenase beta subunit